MEVLAIILFPAFTYGFAYVRINKIKNKTGTSQRSIAFYKKQCAVKKTDR